MKRTVALAAILLAAFLVGTAPAAGRRDVLQDIPRLTWLTPGFLPSDGLLTVGAGGSWYTPAYLPDNGNPDEYTVWQGNVFAHWIPLPGLALSYDQHYRQWSDYAGVAGAEPTGSGLSDGVWRVAVAAPGLPDWLGVVAYGGGNAPVGSEELGEDAFSPEAGVTVSLAFWRESLLPEMRLHASVGRRWNSNEESGFGATPALRPQPWYPQYPSSAMAGGDDKNDFLTWGVAVEFRRSAASLWLEFSEQALSGADNVMPMEDQKVLAAGLRWGLEEGWALHADYQVGFWKNNLQNDWFPAQPDLGYSLAISRQFSLGGRDRDGDGIPDRRDLCPREPEDRDRFQDADGCPDLDNDEDGIPDDVDLAPMDPEDFDGWQDEDGLPEPDNDGDGILDRYDACPDEAEDLDGYKDGDGCPEEFLDRDGDGIADEDDLCPDSPEDLDGFQDKDGCPDPDNDLDGIDDADDACPDEPEDYDGDRDDDGCPDGAEDASEEQ